MREYYTYAYLRENGTPYYIGKGKGRRIHLKAGSAVHLPPKERRIFLKKNLTEQEAFKHEVYMIAVFGRKDQGNGILWNFTDGGEGTSGYKWTPEQKKQLSESSTGKRYGEEMKEKMRFLMTGLKRSAETRKKLSESLQVNKPMKGKKRSEETKRKIAESMRGNTNRKKSIDR